jgi:MbtH protein
MGDYRALTRLCSATAPPSSLQRGSWFPGRLTPDYAANNLPRVLELDGPVGRIYPAALQHAHDTIGARHEALQLHSPMEYAAMTNEEYYAMDAFTEFSVVVNDEEQYSLWPTAIPIPLGWSAEGTTGTEEHCLDRIGRIWPDVRPRSLRESIERRRAGEPAR